MLTILRDVFLALCYLLGIGCVGLFVVMMFLVIRGCVDQLRKRDK